MPTTGLDILRLLAEANGPLIATAISERVDLPPGTRARRLRLTVLATNGDPSAAVYEVRCY